MNSNPFRGARTTPTPHRQTDEARELAARVELWIENAQRRLDEGNRDKAHIAFNEALGLTQKLQDEIRVLFRDTGTA